MKLGRGVDRKADFLQGLDKDPSLEFFKVPSE